MKNIKNFILVNLLLLLSAMQVVSAQGDPYANGVQPDANNEPVGTPVNVVFGIGNNAGASSALAPNSVQWTINFPRNILDVGVGVFPPGFYEYSRTIGTSLIIVVRNNVAIPAPGIFTPQDFLFTYPVTGTVANLQGTISNQCQTLPGFPTQSDINVVNNTASTPIIFAPPIATPVTLTTFAGTLENNESNLTWTVWGEKGISNYEVLRSTNSIDFVSVGKVAANNSKNYHLIDNVAGLGNKFYYKLKMNENSNEYKYSKVIVLSKNAVDRITVYPNPVSNVVNISSLIGTETISIFSIDGKKIMEQKASEGNNAIDITKLSSGTYNLVISNGAEVSTFKVVKN